MPDIWITKNGAEIPVDELTLEHARSIVRMIVRRRQYLITKAADELALEEDLARLAYFASRGRDQYGSVDT